MPKRITDQDRQAVLDLHAAGTARNQIVRETGVSAGTVTKIIHDAGGNFNRQATKDATEARRADLAKRRADLMEVLVDDAFRLRAQVWQPHTYFEWGGKNHTYAEKLAAEPMPADKLKLMQAAGAAIDRSIKIDQYAKDDGSESVKSMLGDLFAEIQHRAGPDPEDVTE